MIHQRWRLLGIGLVIACADTSRDPAVLPDTAAAADTLAPGANVSVADWQVRRLDLAPPRFRPGGWSDEHVLWGLLRGQVTRLDTRTGAVSSPAQTAWSVHAAPDLVSWRNERGTWLLRDGGEVIRLAGPEVDPHTGFDGPPTVLWSQDGSRAVLAWSGEWDAHHELIERDGSTRKLETATPAYFGNSAVLWLDSARVLFQTVAKGPVGGEPTYRESGWRGDLAVLDLRSNAYTRVTSVPDFTYLRVAGLHLKDVLVTEWDTAGVRAHWFYDPRTWRRRPAPLPTGWRAFAAQAGAVVVLLEGQGDTTNSVLVAAGDTLALGRVARDAEPVFSPTGRRGALRNEQGVIVFERANDLTQW